MKPKYEEYVKPRLDEITEMAKTMMEEQIAETLGIGKSSWYKYKAEHTELSEAVKKGRQKLAGELKSTLIQKAQGYVYEEKKTIKEKGVVIREEIYVKKAHPDVAAINLLLKNYDPDWRNDPAEYELKKKALELQEKKLEDSKW
jgi:hypothetical protein